VTGGRAPLAAAASIAALLCASCGRAASPVDARTRTVSALVIATALVPDEIAAFGNLTFISKVDVSAPQDALIEDLPYREGDAIPAGGVVARLRNRQAELAVGQAENGVARAAAALALADARLFEGRLAAESRIMGIENTELEIVQAKKELQESRRRLDDQETLYRAGGIAEETIRAGRFSLAAAAEDVALMERNLSVRLVGLRDEDLSARGMDAPADTEARRRALAALSTAALAAELDAAAADLAVARKDLEGAAAVVADLTVRVTEGGVVGARYMEVGERVKRGDRLVTIMATGALYAVASIGEADAARVRSGMRAKVTVDAAGDGFDGIVDLVSPVAESSTASVSVRIRIDDPGDRLKPGMFARATVIVGPPRYVVALPARAIAERSGNTCSVFAISGGRIYQKRIDIGDALDGDWIALDGLVEGDVVVDRPDPGLKEGDRVDVSS